MVYDEIYGLESLSIYEGDWVPNFKFGRASAKFLVSEALIPLG